jgi:hypothetical protein
MSTKKLPRRGYLFNKIIYFYRSSERVKRSPWNMQCRLCKDQYPGGKHFFVRERLASYTSMRSYALRHARGAHGWGLPQYFPYDES